MHAGPYEVAFRGCRHGTAFLGGTHRSAGAAYGIPRYLFTTDEACGRLVATPMTTPESMVAVGPGGEKDCSTAARLPAHRASKRMMGLFFILDNRY